MEHLQSSSLWRSNLSKANLIRTNLKGANLRFANLENADLWKANLKNADLENANLKEAKLPKYVTNEKRFTTRLELRGRDGNWERRSTHEDNILYELDWQDKGKTLKLFKHKGIYATVKLVDSECYSHTNLPIKTPIYLVPEQYAEIGRTVYVPIGDSWNNKAVIDKIIGWQPDFVVRVIDNVE